jgi:hypothetical protein
MSTFPLFEGTSGPGETKGLGGAWGPPDLAESFLTERKPKPFSFSLSIVLIAIFIWKKMHFHLSSLKTDYFDKYVQLKKR